MKNILLFTLLNVFIFVSCSEEEKNSRNDGTVEFFRENLKKDMSAESIVKCFGEPLRDMGSGIHIYVYQLNDTTEVWIGVTDTVFYAQHRDESQQILSILI